MVGIAQLARAPDCGSGGQGFNSLYPPQEIIGLSSSGKTQHFDCCIRGFESRQPSHSCLKFNMMYDPLAQLAEHLTFNQGVRGSNPRWVTKDPRS